MRYIEDKELKLLGNAIIGESRPNLQMLSISYLFRDKATVTDGKVITGRCIRVDDRNWALHKKDVLIEIARDIWEEMDARFQKALMDHELGHIGLEFDEDKTIKMEETTGRIKVRIRRHDIEEFSDVLERHGAYHKALREFLAAYARRIEAQKKNQPAPVAEVKDLE